MKRRYLYLLMFFFPSLLTSMVCGVFVFGMLAGAMWMFVYGDKPWSEGAGWALLAGLLMVWLGLMAWFMRMAWRAGKRAEQAPEFNRKHMVFAGLATMGIIGIMFAHQAGVGNIGDKSESAVCSSWCSAQGRAGSGLDPRIKPAQERFCSCYGEDGKDAAKIPVEELMKHPNPSIAK